MLEFRDVEYAVDGVRPLKSISLELGDEEFVVLAGANGSGKTTLLRHCNGLLTPTSGVVLVDGTPVEDDLVAARTAVGMVFQHPRDQFVAATVGEDVAFGPENLGLDREEIEDRVECALEAVRLEGRESDRIDTLSGGEQSRVAIAGALAMEPGHLVLDEPFTGLDEPARRTVLERLESLSAAGTGVVVATHDLRDVLEVADRLVVMHDGRVAVDVYVDADTDADRIVDADEHGGGDGDRKLTRELERLGVRVPSAIARRVDTEPTDEERLAR